MGENVLPTQRLRLLAEKITWKRGPEAIGFEDRWAKKIRENVVPSADRQGLRLLAEKNYLKNKVPRGYRL